MSLYFFKKIPFRIWFCSWILWRRRYLHCTHRFCFWLRQNYFFLKLIKLVLWNFNYIRSWLLIRCMLRFAFTKDTLREGSTMVRINKWTFLYPDFLLAKSWVVIMFRGFLYLFIRRWLIFTPWSLRSLFSFSTFIFFSCWRFSIFWKVLRMISSLFLWLFIWTSWFLNSLLLFWI